MPMEFPTAKLRAWNATLSKLTRETQMMQMMSHPPPSFSPRFASLSHAACSSFRGHENQQPRTWTVDI
jgi:hypothetical protein